MDGECRYAAVLQLLGQGGYHQVVGTPSQPCLHRYGQFYRLHHTVRYLKHQGDILQHACSGPLASHFLHRTTEVEVDHIGCRLLHDACRLYHSLHVAPVDLYAHGALFIADGELVNSGLDGAHQCLGTDKLGIYHGSTEALAQHSEANIGDILHGCQHHGLVS